jgi:GNAT superfamily N-acetyltransferase
VIPEHRPTVADEPRRASAIVPELDAQDRGSRAADTDPSLGSPAVPSAPQPAIAPLEHAQRRAAADVLVRAFDDSPIMRYLLPGERLRVRGLRAFFGAAVNDALPFGEVWAARVDGAVAALAPVAPRAPRRLTRSLRYLSVVERAHPKEPHWYLGFLGVDPPLQGQGIGTRLLEAVLPRIDESGEAAYLETDKERNIPYYARQRFELVDTLHPATGGPPTWTMWRAPR